MKAIKICLKGKDKASMYLKRLKLNLTIQVIIPPNNLLASMHKLIDRKLTKREILKLQKKHEKEKMKEA